MMSHDQGAVIVEDEIFPEAFARIIRFLTAPDPFPLKRKKEIETIQLDRALTDEQDKELKEINQMTYITREREGNKLFSSDLNSRTLIFDGDTGALHLTKEKLSEILGPKTADLIISYSKKRITEIVDAVDAEIDKTILRAERLVDEGRTTNASVEA